MKEKRWPKHICLFAVVLVLPLSSLGGVSALAGESVTAPADSVSVKALSVLDSGTCGNNLTWVLTSDYTLTISGTGAMTDWDQSTLKQMPWYSYRLNIEEIVIEEGVTTIGDYAFNWFESLEAVTVPDSLISIGDHAFFYSQIKEIVLPEGLVSIGDSAFSITPLGSINIPSSVSYIGARAFYGTSIQSLTLPEGLEEIGDDTFMYCWNLTDINIPSTVTKIGEQAFRECGFSEITLPDGLETIEEWVFYACGSLESITIPAGITEIEEKAFYNCTALTDVYFIGTEAQWNAINVASGNDCLLNANIHFYDFPVLLEDTEVILRNTDTYYLHAEINSIYADDASAAEAALEELTWYSDDEDVLTVAGEYSYNAVTGEVLFPLEVESTGTATVTAVDGDGDEACAEVKVVLFFKTGTDTNQFTNSSLSWTFSDLNYKEQLWAQAASVWERVCLNINYGLTDGVCHGISYTMCLGQQGLVDFDSLTADAACYSDLSDPQTNSSFHDLLAYYQMLQMTSAGEPTQSVDNSEGWFETSVQYRLKVFLKALVAEAKDCEESETPFLFGFRYNDNNTGHTVVVCGYSQSGSGDHEIWIVDPNSYQSGVTVHDYLIMTVASDYSSFSFQDEIRINAGTDLADIWDCLMFYSADTIYSSSVLLKTSAVSAADTETIQISCGEPFRLENDQGEYVEYDGENYAGTMTVYDCKTAGIEGSVYWNLTVDDSSYYVLTNTGGNCVVGCAFNEQEYVVSAYGADRVKISADGVEAFGEAYSLDVYVETAACDMVEAAADFTGDSVIQYDAGTDTVAVTGSSDAGTVTVTYYDGAYSVEEQADLSSGGMVIDVTTGAEKVASYISSLKNSSSTSASTQKEKKKQKITVKKSSLKKTLKAKKLKKKNQTFKLKASTSGNGKITYKKVKGNKKIKVSKAGKVTVKKGLKKGKTYKVKVKVTAAKTSTYKKATKTVTLKIKIK